jgi:HEPN domain-containing protein
MNAAARRARGWVAKADNDLLNADNNLAANEIPTDTVCFHCQQAAEKLLKGFLVSHDMEAPRTHDLLALLESVLPYSQDAERLRSEFALLMPFSVAVRYPQEFMPSIDDARDARNAAAVIREWLNTAAPHLLVATR